ncbi:unnamed protein product [Hymenolepis diminuta]|uniref:Uncharacterized protein n=1 Tax=Hymenolepis diminuta TaxID=6216 RepID=A0A564YZW0_HYMDI|nr:unnamed protein product [Hymenolepis diminuta]
MGLPINPICSRVHSATSSTSFTAEVMIQRSPEVFLESLGLDIHTMTTSKLITVSLAALSMVKNLNAWNKTCFLFKMGCVYCCCYSESK